MPVKVDDLPGSVLGLQAVDAIVWFDAEAREISSGGTGAFEAIQQYVKEGGQLVICQPAERARIAAFADAGMLPVEAKDADGALAQRLQARAQARPAAALRPGGQPRAPGRKTTQLPQLAVDRPQLGPGPREQQGVRDLPRQGQAGRRGGRARRLGRRQGRDAATRRPYIARRAYGMGSVVWVAQDLGSHALTTVRETTPDPADPESHGSVGTGGWPYVWDKVFGWNNQTIIRDDWNRGESLRHPPPRVPGGQRRRPSNLGKSLASGMEASARGAWLVTVAIFFFIVYWIVAGPGSYFFLAQRKQKGLSWTVFAAAALVATAVTVGVVKLVLRGDPEVHHITIIQLSPDAPAADGSPRFAAVASSRFGLYIPRDGVQTVELTGASDKEPSYVIPLPPGLLKENEAGGFTDTQQLRRRHRRLHLRRRERRLPLPQHAQEDPDPMGGRHRPGDRRGGRIGRPVRASPTRRTPTRRNPRTGR